MTRSGLLPLVVTCLAGFSLFPAGTACPGRCLCHLGQQPRSVMCSKQGLQMFPENISDIVEHLDLSSNQLTDITGDINRLVDLQYLNLARNQLSSLPEDLSALKNLRRLDLSENKIHSVVDISAVQQLPALAVLYLSKNPLASLEGLTSSAIQVMDASHCDMKEITNTSLDGLPALTTLSLAGNPLRFIHEVQSTNLQWLDMSDCHLNYLNPDAFSGLPELEELNMNNNPTLVYSTRRSTLKHLKLKKLDVSRCNLDRPGLHGFPSLTHARLTGNAIWLLPDRIFAKNRQLTYLYLNSNGVNILNSGTFEGLVKLQVLDLSANELEEIHPLAFYDNVDLKLLNLSYNGLYEFPNLTSAVTSLDMSSNSITKLDRDSLSNMPKLRSLNLSNNLLNTIPAGLKSPTMRNLDVKKNMLRSLSNDSFVELPQLLRIDLSENRLKEAVTATMFRNNPDVVTIRLDGNPWRCDCLQLYQSHNFLTEPPAKAARSSLICDSPANISGFSWEAACFDVWNGTLYYNKDRTWGLVMISMLTVIVLFGSVVSIRHTMRVKRRVLEQRQQMERTETRERLRLIQRRHQRVEDGISERPPEPRIHPMELIGPPSYEEAVQMPRLAQSLDALNEISVETSTMRMVGSVDNLRTKKRRNRRPRKRTQSVDDLLKRQERRQERIRRERNNSTGTIDTDVSQIVGQRNVRFSVAHRSRRHSMMEDSIDSGSGKSRPRPQTPSAKKKKRRHTIHNGHSTDDEDSDVQAIGSSRSIVIRELRKEPRSGYRESIVERDS